MIDVRKTDEFGTWLAKLRDRQGRARIIERLEMLDEGYFGDAKAVGGGINELRFHFSPGYRVYFVRQVIDGVVVILLAGGNKDSQIRDIAGARILAKQELEL